jgi:Protein of unknown function (DUF1552)
MNRRSLFKAIAAGSLTAVHPLASIVTRSAMAQTGTAPIRTIFVYYPEGTVPDLFFPKVGSRQLPVQSQPLQELYNNLVFIDGLAYTGAFTGYAPADGARRCLSGSGAANVTSLDVLMGREDWTKRQTTGIRLPTIQLNVGLESSGDGISWDNGVASPTHPDPRKAYAKLFGTAAGGGAVSDKTSTDILSLARQDLAVIRANIGNIDGQRERLDLHTDALSLLEQKLAGGALPNTGAGCVLPEMTRAPNIAGADNRADWSTPDILPLASELQQDLAIAALSCGITKSIVMPYCGDIGYVTCPDCTVGVAPMAWTRDETHTQSVRWWMGEVAKLIKKLAAVPDQNGALLDNTILLTVSNSAEGSHARYRLPTILASGVNNNVGLVTGRSLDWRNAPNRTYIANVGSYVVVNGQSTQSVNAIGHTNVLDTIQKVAGYTSITLPETYGGIMGAWKGGDLPV